MVSCCRCFRWVSLLDFCDVVVRRDKVRPTDFTRSKIRVIAKRSRAIRLIGQGEIGAVFGRVER
jgi:hypothetical protein